MTCIGGCTTLDRIWWIKREREWGTSCGCNRRELNVAQANKQTNKHSLSLQSKQSQTASSRHYLRQWKFHSRELRFRLQLKPQLQLQLQPLPQSQLLFQPVAWPALTVAHKLQKLALTSNAASLIFAIFSRTSRPTRSSQTPTKMRLLLCASGVHLCN